MPKILEWKDEYSVGVMEIDEQHKKIFAILNELTEAVQNNQEKIIMQAILEKLDQYVFEHFSTEENYFNQFNYEEKEHHVQEHSFYMQKIREFKQKFEMEGKNPADEMIDFLKEWIVSHVTGTDQKYKNFFTENGLS